MQSRWKRKQCDEAAVEALKQSLNISELLARIVVLRGITDPEEAKEFLFQDDLSALCSPMLLSGMDILTERVWKAIAQREKILIYGDYDVDGICSVVILVECLRYLGADVDYRVPNRFSEGYGLNCGAIEEIFALGYQLILTVDCGITSIEEAECCRELGIDLIITDHHTPGKILPNAAALINPKLDNHESSWNLCGAGIAFKTACALTGNDAPEAIFKEWVILAALATVADVVPLLLENRVLLKKGLQWMSESTRPGLRKLLQAEGLFEQRITTEKLAFQVIPKLNSAGRLETADISIQTLLTKDDAEADELVQYLLSLNEKRRQIEDEMMQKAIASIESNPHFLNNPLLLVQGDEWNHGVVGILASRLVAKYHKPTLVISWDHGIGKGSGRSIEGVSLYDILSSGREHLLRFGGHKMAAGLTITKENFSVYYQTIMQKAEEIMRQMPDEYIYWFDAEVTPQQLLQEGDTLLRQLEPMGEGNPPPLFLLRGTEADFYKKIGKKQEHILCRIGKLDGIAFQKASQLQRTQMICQQDMIVGLSENEYMGVKRLQILIKEFSPSFQYCEKTGGTPAPFIQKIQYMTHCLLQRKPVLLLYDDVRSLQKHSVLLKFYFKANYLCMLHGEIPRENQSFAEYALARGEGRLFLFTYAALKQWQRKNVFPARLQDVFCCWNRPRREEKPLFPETVRCLRWEEELPLEDTGKVLPQKKMEAPEAGHGIIYLNRMTSIQQVKQRFGGDLLNETRQEMGERVLLRNQWRRYGKPLATDGVPFLPELDGGQMPDWVELADVPYSYCELQPYFQPNTQLIRSFSDVEIEKAWGILNRMYPEDDRFLQQIRQFLLQEMELYRVYHIEVERFLRLYQEKTGQKAGILEIEGALHIFRDLGFCEYRRKGTVLTIKLLSNAQFLKKENALWFMEGLESKASFCYCLKKIAVPVEKFA